MGFHNKIWDEQQDQILARHVLDSLEVGESKSQAFREVARKLGRTSASVAFRWNGTVGKKFVPEVQQAAEVGSKRKRGLRTLTKEVKHKEIPDILITKVKTLETVIEDIRTLFSQTTTQIVDNEEILRLQNKIVELEQKNKELEEKLGQVQQIFTNLSSMKIGG